MSVKTAVSFIDDHHQFAKELVEQGAFASVSAVVAAGIQKLRDEAQERDIALNAMADEIRRRAETSDTEFVEHKTGDFAAILARVDAGRTGAE